VITHDSTDMLCRACGAPAGIPCTWHARLTEDGLPPLDHVVSLERARESMGALDGAMDRLGVPA
jgi:hypothetical protein